ncbi:GNAT family N-acetyltransferase [Flavihumibacter sp. UBA7668]|uniref:GNAT family N-acetyltransferase n=1 Tax=Flavihumibacter sp. UBA7668 TaxID=1946542 RepID=UPI0025BD13A1|nr:GNAT family N-acetyltransferase [Flavihumibacter sp. UBA7668]
MNFLTVTLTGLHERESFCCGNAQLDIYFQKQAKQDIKRKLSVCFVLPDGNKVKGYYTLSSASVIRAQLPEDLIKKLPPSYTDLPVILLGRLAVSQEYQGQGLGETILMDALSRSYQVSLQIGSMAVVVDPIDQAAIKFYEKYGFIQLPDSGKMFLPMATIAQLHG